MKSHLLDMLFPSLYPLHEANSVYLAKGRVKPIPHFLASKVVFKMHFKLCTFFGPLP